MCVAAFISDLLAEGLLENRVREVASHLGRTVISRREIWLFWGMIPDFCGPSSDLIFCVLGEYEHVQAQEQGTMAAKQLPEKLVDVGTSITAHEMVRCHHLPSLGCIHSFK